MPNRTTLQYGLGLLATALATLWSVDVLAHLDLAGRLLRGDLLPSRVSDFAALAAVLAPTAAALAIAAWVGGAILGRLLPSGRGARSEGIALVAGALGGFVALAEIRLAGLLGGSRRPLAFAAAGLVGLVLWLGIRWLRSRRDRPDSLSEAAAWGLYPASILALAFDAARGGGPVSVLLAVAAALGLAVLARSPGGRAGAALAWAPAALGLLIALATVAASARYGAGADLPRRGERGSRPDLVLIVLDTVRADHLRSYGYRRDTMPALESWAAGAAVYQRAVAPAGWTGPTHASLFTGLPVSLHGVHYAHDAGPTLGTRPYEGLSWLPQRLAREGYASLAVSANPFAVPPEAGFDRLFDRTRFAWEQGTIGALTERFPPSLARFSEAAGWRMPYIDAAGITDAVVRAVPADGGPLFLFVNYLDAHSPYNPPPEALRLLGLHPAPPFSRYLAHRTLTQRWEQMPAGAQEELVELYDGSLRWLDLHLARLLDWIDRHLGEGSVVVITSDHGEELGEHGRVGHEHGLPQEVVHVPLLVRAPGLEPGVRGEMVSLRGLYPALLGAATGAPAWGSLGDPGDGFGLIAERYPSRLNESSVGAGALRPWVALFEDELKAVGPSEAGFELYDIRTAGFGREVPIAPDEAGGLAETIDAYWAEHRDRRGEEGGEVSEEELRRLRSLGYVQ